MYRTNSDYPRQSFFGNFTRYERVIWSLMIIVFFRYKPAKVSAAEVNFEIMGYCWKRRWKRKRLSLKLYSVIRFKEKRLNVLILATMQHARNSCCFYVMTRASEDCLSLTHSWSARETCHKICSWYWMNVWNEISPTRSPLSRNAWYLILS